MLIDTHAHLHFKEYAGEVDELIARAAAAGVEKMICVGVDGADSTRTAELAGRYANVWATAGLHPHDAGRGPAAFDQIQALARQAKVAAIGECGLDYFKEYSPRADQRRAFERQIELALEHDLPMVWHVREAFDDFFAMIDSYRGLRGVVHSFTGNYTNMIQAVERGLMVALNGIMTFTKDAEQLKAARLLPLDNLVLETDCPFLAPVPHRGRRNEPAYLPDTARFLAKLRGEEYEQLADATTRNAEQLFGLL